MGRGGFTTVTKVVVAQRRTQQRWSFLASCRGGRSEAATQQGGAARRRTTVTAGRVQNDVTGRARVDQLMAPDDKISILASNSHLVSMNPKGARRFQTKW